MGSIPPGEDSTPTPAAPSPIPTSSTARGLGRPPQPPIEEQEPRRKDGDDQRRRPGRDGLLGPRHPAVTQDELEYRRDGRVPPMPGRGHRPARAATEGEKDRSRDEEPRAGHQERRKGIDRQPDGQVGRAPQHVNRGECEQQPGPRRFRRSSSHPTLFPLTVPFCPASCHLGNFIELADRT
jgi:hypothetical protein